MKRKYLKLTPEEASYLIALLSKYFFIEECRNAARWLTGKIKP